MKKLDRRWSIGIGVAVAFHVFLAALIGVFGISYMEDVPEQILEVSIGGGGGGSSSKSGKAVNSSSSEEESFTSSVMKSLDDIIDPEKIVKEEKAQEQPKAEEKKQDVDSNEKAPAGSSTVNRGSGDGSGEGSGKGSGQGSGEGSGKGSGSGDGVGDGKGVAVTPPRILKKAEPKYPPIARKNDIEGTVYVKMLVGTNGLVEKAIVARSSGNDSLDNAAVEVTYKWKFSPAKDKYGINSRCYITMPIRFVLH